MSEIEIHGSFVVNLKENSDGHNINLDHAEFALFIGTVSNEGNWSAGQIAIDLRGTKTLEE